MRNKYTFYLHYIIAISEEYAGILSLNYVIIK